MKLREPYHTVPYHPGASDAVWIMHGDNIVALLSAENALKYYGPMDWDEETEDVHDGQQIDWDA